MLVEIAVVAADTSFRDNSRERVVMVSIGSNYETDEHLGNVRADDFSSARGGSTV